MNESMRLARQRAADIAWAIDSGAGTVELLRARFPSASQTSVRTSIAYLVKNGYAERIEAEAVRYRAIYALTKPAAQIVEEVMPKPMASAEFSLLEKCMGIPAEVLAVMSERRPVRSVERMACSDEKLGRPKEIHR